MGFVLHYRRMNTRVFSKRYLLHEQLGSGGEGVIYRATDRLTTRTVAVKRVRLDSDEGGSSHSSQMTNASRKILIAHEFQTLATLRHPNVISVLDYGFTTDAEEDIPYFVMEYLPNARTIVEAGVSLSLEKKIDLLIQMLQALHYLHQRGILHRDLKPANALVVGDHLKVLDFGLSAFVEKARGTSGTLPYMPPEFMQDEPLSAASDLYSVGVMGYELLAGKHPFRLKDPSHLVMDILFAEPDFDGIKAPDAICMILEKLMAKVPDDRFQSAQEVIQALSTALGQPLPRETEAIRESFLRQAAFVGRMVEMQQLLTSLDGLLVPNGTPRAWLIGGESGVGKSRLLQEFRAQALVRGSVVLQGSVGEHPSPYQLWHDPLQLLSVLTPVDSEQASVLKAIVPDIERVLPGVPFVLEPMALEGQAHTSRMLAVLRTLFQQLVQGDAGPLPVILVFEDVQWAGSESLALLRELQDVVTDLPVMLLASFHTDETPHLFEQFPTFGQITLPRLHSAEVAMLSQAILGATDEQLNALLYRETEGNALFLIETLRTLAEEAGRLTDIRKGQLPEVVRAVSVENLLAQRLARVPGETRQLLALAAVLGRQLDPQLLTQNWAWRISWEEWLLELSNAAILQLVEGHWVFTHEKLRRAVLSQQPAHRLRALHVRAAEGIEKAYPDQPGYWGKLAFHWREAEVFEREFHYLSLAGPYFLRTSAYQEAVNMFARGLALIEAGKVEATVDQQADFLVKQAHALSSLGEYEQANQVYQTALAFSQMHGLDKYVAEGYLGLARKDDVLGNYREAQNFYGWALMIFEKLGEIKNAAFSRMGLGRVAFRLGSFEEAKLAYQLSLDTFREIGEKQGEGSVLCGLGDTARVQGDFVLAKQNFLAAQQVYQEIGNRDGTSIAFNNLGVLAETQGLYSEALEWHQKSLDIKREIGVRQGIAISLSNLGVVHYSLNEFETSRKYAEETATLYKALNDRQGMADSYNNLGLLDFHMRDYHQARERLGLALDLCEQMGDQWGVALAHLNLGKVARELHAFGNANRHFAEALELAKILKLDSVILQTIIEYAPILLHAGDGYRAVLYLSHAVHNPKTPGFERILARELLVQIRSELSDDAYTHAYETGKIYSLDEIVKAVGLLFRDGVRSK